MQRLTVRLSIHSVFVAFEKAVEYERRPYSHNPWREFGLTGLGLSIRYRHASRMSLSSRRHISKGATGCLQRTSLRTRDEDRNITVQTRVGCCGRSRAAGVQDTNSEACVIVKTLHQLLCPDNRS